MRSPTSSTILVVFFIFHFSFSIFLVILTFQLSVSSVSLFFSKQARVSKSLNQTTLQPATCACTEYVHVVPRVTRMMICRRSTI